MTTVTLPHSLTNIDRGPFSYCTGLNGITLDGPSPFYSCVDGVLFDASQTRLIQCPGGKTGTYAIPDSVTTVGDDAFTACTSLAHITISDSVTNIGYWAFTSCDSLTNLTLPNNLHRLRSYTFFYCQNLVTITFGNHLTTIESSAFGNCSSLTSLIIPRSVINIEGEAFSACFNLARVHFQGDAPSPQAHVFYSCDMATIYYLPGTTGWGLTFSGRPTAPWYLPYPVILDFGPSFGLQTNRFGFIISWATNASVHVEATMALTTGTWSSVATNSLTAGSSSFSDPQWTNHPARFYRVRSP